MSGGSPTERTLQEWRSRGAIADVVERWISAPDGAGGFRTRGHKKDLFGFIDIVVVHENRIIGVQATSGDHVAHRLTKIKEECAAKAIRWLEAGGLLQVIGWKKYAKREGGRLWRPIERWVTLEDVRPVVAVEVPA